MRRPLKPFVTEYKGSGRRPKEAAGSDQAFNGDARAIGAFDFKPHEAAPRDARVRAPHPSPRADARLSLIGSEDGYEAALRAADALFAPLNNDAKSLQPERAGVEQASGGEAWPEDVTSAIGKAPPTGNGRILRSLEEPPAPSYADREEAQPKRRGRKPGSKNKPKVLVLHDAGAPSSVTGEMGETVRPRVRETDRERPRAAARRGSAGAIPAGSTVADAPRVMPARAAPLLTSTRPRGKRFGWVRTKLAAGERWKRRLPKVIW